MNNTRYYFHVVAFFISMLPFLAKAQDVRKHITLEWKGIQVVDKIDTLSVKALSFSGSVNNSLHNFAPLFHQTFNLPPHVSDSKVVISNASYETIGNKEIESLSFPISSSDSLSIVQNVGIARGVLILDIQFIPVIKSIDGKFLKLSSFDLELTYVHGNSFLSFKGAEYTNTSVLSSGKWYKVRVNKTGICKVTYSDLQSMGVDMATVNPDHIRVFGKPGGMLPENNSFFRHDDLPENAIQVMVANEGVFAQGDYFLFYATSPDEVVFNTTSRKFEHRQNLYSDYTYYFLNFDGAAGKRTGLQPQTTLAPKYTCNTFIDFGFYEKDIYNLIKSGKQWIGERLDFNNASFSLPAFSFANVETIKQAWIRYRLVSRASSSSNFTITANSNTITSRSLPAFTLDTFSQEAVETKTFTPVEGNQQISIKYNTPSNTDLGYIDWIEVSVPRKMQFTGGQMAFADPVSAVAGNITEFKLQAASSQVVIWEVTDPVNVKKVDAQLDGDLLKFVLPTDSIRRFVAWDNSSFNTVEFEEIVDNQNLHGIENAEMLIVTFPGFLAQANRLANHHRTFDGMTVTVATNQQIYNEFSSGSPDISAIRDFARMLYQRPLGKGKLKYLLLFGDGSYDYKDHLPQNTNYVLAFQTQESQNLVFSTASDDFFGLLDSNEGNDAFGKLDIGVGRFPIDNVEQAEQMVDKCIFYASGSPENLGNWRNSLCFVADDEDSNTHIRQVEDQVTPPIEKNHKVYNINKIYLDAYTQVSTPGGARYPEVNAAINDAVQNGVLIMNYTGHGGETGWATEAILSLNDINSWTNYSRMSVFVTATCEFSRCDDPGRVSAGEQVFLNPAGGGVALFTTTRLANAGNNVELTMDLYDTIFSSVNGEHPRLGDIIAYAKNQNSGVALIRNFMLLGDPALHLAYPKHNVITTKINGRKLDEGSDTIAAMSKVEIEGMIADNAGNLVNSFNGTVNVKVYDKYRWMMTRGNDPGSFKRYFDVQENILYQGNATVTAGEFNVSFIVPRDIDFSYGMGKISYYAQSEFTDATGYCDSIVIGGSSNEVSTDSNGPLINLYMNDERFVNGGTTGENPMLLAFLSDESGLNTVGNGIGHDLVATLDGNSVNSIVLNDYYQADLDSYRAGKVMYNFQELADGPHTLELKAWDVFNNSSEAKIEFVVRKNLAIKVISIKAFPNPFDQEIQVEFEHNLFNSPLDATLDIFSLNGALVRSIGPVSLFSQGYSAGIISWDGRNNAGAFVNDGIFLLRIRATNGKTTSDKTIRVIKLSNRQ